MQFVINGAKHRGKLKDYDDIQIDRSRYIRATPCIRTAAGVCLPVCELQSKCQLSSNFPDYAEENAERIDFPWLWWFCYWKTPIYFAIGIKAGIIGELGCSHPVRFQSKSPDFLIRNPDLRHQESWFPIEKYWIFMINAAPGRRAQDVSHKRSIKSMTKILHCAKYNKI